MAMAGGCASPAYFGTDGYSGRLERIHFVTSAGDTLTPSAVTHICRLDDGSMAISTAQGMLVVRDMELRRRIDFPKRITALASLNGEIFAGTEKGLYRLAGGKESFEPVDLPAIDPHPSITALALANDGRLWIGTMRNSLFTLKDGAIDPVMGAPYVSSLAATSDSSIWIGTNAGLHRVRDGKYYVYTEEIHHYGLAIPDNIVEHLSVDQGGNLWIFMSQAVSALSPTQFSAKEGDHIDPLTYAYLGARENEIIQLVDGPSGSRWLATGQGVMVLKEIELDHEGGVHEEGLGDILTPPEGRLVNLSQSIVADSLFAGAKPYALTFDPRGNLLVGADNGLWRIGRVLAEKVAAPPSQLSSNR